MSPKLKDKRSNQISTPVVFVLIVPIAILALICLILVSIALGAFILGAILDTATIKNNMPDLPLPVLSMIFLSTLGCLLCLVVVIRRCFSGINRFNNLYNEQARIHEMIRSKKSDSSEFYEDAEATQKQQYQ